MSWKERTRIFKLIEDQIEKEQLTLDDVLENEHFLNALGQQIPNLSNFIANNVKELLDIAVGLTKPKDKSNRDKCLLALVSHNSKVSDALTKNAELANYIASLISQDIILTKYFRILSFSVDSSCGDFLKLIKEPKLFFKQLIDKINITPVYEYLTNLCLGRFDPIVLFLETVNAGQILLQKLTCEEEIVILSLKLINLLLDLPQSSPIWKNLTTSHVFQIIFDTGIEGATTAVSEMSFRVNFKILAQRIDADQKPEADHKSDNDETKSDNKETKSDNDKEKDDDEPQTKKAEEKPVTEEEESVDDNEVDLMLEIISQKFTRIYDFITRDKEYTGDKHWAVNLAKVAVMINNNLHPCVIDLLSFLFDLFFEYPTNSFLHCAFLELFQALAEHKEWREIVAKLRVAERVQKAYSERRNHPNSYTGFLLHIADSIREWSEGDGGDEIGDDGWTNFLETTVAPSMELEEEGRRFVEEFGCPEHSDESEPEESD